MPYEAEVLLKTFRRAWEESHAPIKALVTDNELYTEALFELAFIVGHCLNITHACLFRDL